MARAPIRHRSLSEDVYRRLMRGILDGRFAAGEPLREERLCRELGVSRTPLREAMIRLAREGVLEQQPRRGCMVRQLPEREITELLECRRLLEVLVLREWFGRIDRGRMQALDDCLAAAAAGSDAEAVRREVLAADEALHELVVSACTNRFLAEQVRRLQVLCRPYRVLRCEETADLPAILEERRRILRAVLGNDLEGAAAALAAHFDTSRRYYLPSTAS